MVNSQMVNNYMKMKKYIEPKTQFIALGAERLCQELSSSIVGGDPGTADSPLRIFTGEKYGLKYLI